MINICSVPDEAHVATSSVSKPISESNIGSKMLKAMGWKEGDSLGKRADGILEPIQVFYLDLVSTFWELQQSIMTIKIFPSIVNIIICYF